MHGGLSAIFRGLCSLVLTGSCRRAASSSPRLCPVFPLEIWAAIAAHLHQPEDIVSLACAASSLRFVAERQLYRRACPWTLAALSGLVQALQKDPRRITYVCALRFPIDPAAGTSLGEQHAAQSALSYVLQHCPRLRGLELPEWTLPIPVDVVIDAHLALSTLEVLSDEATDSWLIPLLRTQPRLLDLRVWGVLTLPPPHEGEELLVPHLTSVTGDIDSLPDLAYGRPVERVQVVGLCNPQKIIDGLVGSLGTVKRLVCRPTDKNPEEYLLLLRDGMPDLEDLIVAGVPTQYFSKLASREEVFPHWPSMHSLEMYWDYGSTEELDLSESIDSAVELLLRENPSLAHVSVRGIPYYTWEVPDPAVADDA